MKKQYNTALMFELLVNKINESSLAGDLESASLYSKLIKKHFSKKSNLLKELRLLYGMCFSHHDKLAIESNDYFNTLLNSTLNEFKNIKFNDTKKEIDALLEDIKKSCDINKFLNKKVNHYITLQSAWKILQESRTKNVFKMPKDKALASSVLSNHIKSNNVLKEEALSYEQINKIKETEITNFVFRHMIRKFNRDFGQELNESQRSLISQIIKCDNKNKILNWVLNEYRSIKKSYIEIISKNPNNVNILKESLSSLEDRYKKLQNDSSEFFNDYTNELSVLTLHQGVISEMLEMLSDNNKTL